MCAREYVFFNYIFQEQTIIDSWESKNITRQDDAISMFQYSYENGIIIQTGNSIKLKWQSHS